MTESQEKLQHSSAWRQVEESFLATGDASGVLSALPGMTAAIVLDAYRASIAPAFPNSAALLAGGAYGRRETFPYSGADIIILLDPGVRSEPAREALAVFTRALWNAGLRLNCTMRTLAECLDAHAQNLELAVNLLDRRFLTGDETLHARLENRLPAVIAKHGREISRRLVPLARARHLKYRNTCHHLEPDVKEGPGGLRDLRLIDWLAQLEAEPHAAGDALAPAAAFVSSARCFLHYHAGRDANVLDFDAQQSLPGKAFAHGRSPRQWMREYYRNARVIFQEARRALDASEKSSGSLLDNFREYRARLSNSDFTVSRDRLFIRNPAQLEAGPELIFHLFEFIARHAVPPAPETERRLEPARDLFASSCAQPRPLWPACKTILDCPRPDLALRAMESTGLLSVLFPAWTHIESLPITDAEQRYTVDEYTLGTIECVAALPAASEPGPQRFAGLLSEIESRSLLLLALLFHQTGVDQDDPLPAAVDRARQDMTRLQVPAHDQATVEFLIRHQGDLPAVIGARDVQDPHLARRLADGIGTVEQLKALAVFTYAHLAAIHPEAMSPWREERLWSAYSAVYHELTRELETDRIQQAPPEMAGPAGFIRGFPVRYLRVHTPAEIQTHSALFELSRATGAAVALQPLEGAWQLTVIARDRPSLFASFAGSITSFGMNILKAEAFSNDEGIVLDTFVFADPKRMLQLNPSELERLRDLIQRVALGKTDVQRLMRNRPAQEPRKHAIPPQVQFDSEACETATLVEITAEDRPGLLYSLASVFSSNACNIDIVLIDTKGNRAIDVFYISRDGGKLAPEVQERLKASLISAC